VQIDSTYFVGEILIPNLTGSGVIVTGNVAEVNRFIAKYEPEYLRYVLGDDLYEAFNTAISVNDDLGEDEEPAVIEARWLTLQSKLIDSTNKLSPIADYVYHFHALNGISSTTPAGEVQNKAENSEPAYNFDKIINAYNYAVRQGQIILDWVIEHDSDYPEFDTEHTYELKTINNFGI